MKLDFRRKKYVILGALAAFLAADAAMAAYSIRMASLGVSPQVEIARQTMQLKLLRADVKRANEIQDAMPKTKADCERFENSLPPSATGYSVVSAELEEVSRSAGLHIEALSFHPKDLTGKGMSEVSLDAAVRGDYKSVVRFLNGIQRSQNHYIVDDLTLANERSGQGSLAGVRVNLHLRTYFKATA